MRKNLSINMVEGFFFYVWNLSDGISMDIPKKKILICRIYTSKQYKKALDLHQCFYWFFRRFLYAYINMKKLILSYGISTEKPWKLVDHTVTVTYIIYIYIWSLSCGISIGLLFFIIFLWNPYLTFFRSSIMYKICS